MLQPPLCTDDHLCSLQRPDNPNANHGPADQLHTRLRDPSISTAQPQPPRLHVLVWETGSTHHIVTTPSLHCPYLHTQYPTCHLEPAPESSAHLDSGRKLSSLLGPDVTRLHHRLVPMSVHITTLQSRLLPSFLVPLHRPASPPHTHLGRPFPFFQPHTIQLPMYSSPQISTTTTTTISTTIPPAWNPLPFYE